MSAPRPYETDPFHPLGSITVIKQFPYIYPGVPVVSPMWYVKVYVRMCSCRKTQIKYQSHFYSHFYSHFHSYFYSHFRIDTMHASGIIIWFELTDLKQNRKIV